MRIGHGYDAHRLAAGRKLILGGVEIEYQFGLDGHSDADVLAHAVMDALLGAAGLPDIGQQFPDTEQKYAGADSIMLLAEVGRIIRQNGFEALSIDSTLIAQRPKLAPYIGRMKQNIARALKIEPSCVNVKATTEEKMGFTGAEQGMAAHCVCLLKNT